MQNLFFQHPSIEIVQLPGKGRGFRVKHGHSIKKGELLVREESHLQSARNLNYRTKAYKKLARRLAVSHPQEMEVLYGPDNLSKIRLNEWSRSWNSGCPGDDTNYKTDASHISCTNPCGPDEDQRCSDHRRIYGEVSALKDIAELEEICVTYLDFSRLRIWSPQQRRKYLWRNWEFMCQCVLCSSTVATQ